MPKLLRLAFTVTAVGAMAVAAAALRDGGVTQEPVSPITTTPPSGPRVELGKVLFHDKRLSQDGTLSCASCHDLAQGGADGRPRSVGLGGRLTLRNSPSIFNVSLNFRQAWDGRTDSLHDQTDAVMRDQTVMGSNWGDAVAKLAADAVLAQRFRAAYPDGLQPANVLDALVEYQRSLLTPNARFDRYLRGDANALTAEELRGYALFKRYGCVACHQGVNVGGNMYQVFGVFGSRGAYFDRDGTSGGTTDFGRFNRTRREEDRFVFKVPSLRNVALTAPYLHDGSATTLEQAVDVMFKLQLGRPSRADETELIVKYLHPLTGEREGRPLTGSGR